MSYAQTKAFSINVEDPRSPMYLPYIPEKSNVLRLRELSSYVMSMATADD